jgi:hypothetical protein
MSATFKFKGFVESGLLTSFDRTGFGRAVKTLEGKHVIVTLTDQRSLDQNAYLHAGPLPIFADYMGCSVPEAKYYLMGECWGWHTVGGREIPMKPSTSEMTVAECRHFIDWLLPWALEKHNVELPLPDERVDERGQLVRAS